MHVHVCVCVCMCTKSTLTKIKFFVRKMIIELLKCTIVNVD